MNGPKDTDLKGRVGRYWEGLEVVVVVGKEGAGRWPGGGSSGDPVCSLVVGANPVTCFASCWLQQPH